MFFRILKNELKRKRTMNIILFLFIAMATMFLASSVSNLITVTGAVNYFMEISKVPNRLAIALMETEQDGKGFVYADRFFTCEVGVELEKAAREAELVIRYDEELLSLLQTLDLQECQRK